MKLGKASVGNLQSIPHGHQNKAYSIIIDLNKTSTRKSMLNTVTIKRLVTALPKSSENGGKK
jgi:hypothetical protein